MTGKVWNLEPQSSGVRSSKKLRIYWSPFFQRWIAKAGNSTSGPQNENRKAAQATFSATVKLIKQISGDDCEAASLLAKNTPFLDRDLKMKAASGLLYQWVTDDGTVWVGRRQVYPDIIAALESISSLPGAILVRTEDTWQALIPGEPGQVLTMNAITGLPQWDDATGGGGSTPLLQSLVNGQSAFTESYACVGQLFSVAQDCFLHQAAFWLNGVNGGQYRIGVAPYDSVTKKMTAAPMYTNSILLSAAFSKGSLTFGFTTPVSLPAGNYIMFINRYDSTTTAQISSWYSALDFWGPGITWLASNGTKAIASLNPTTADAWTDRGSGTWSFGAYISFTN